MRRLLIDRDACLAAGAAGLVPAERRHREDHLAVKGDAVFGEDGIVAEDRAAIVPSGDVGGGQNRHDAWRGPYRVEVERGDPAAGGMRGIAGRDMHQRRWLRNVVDKARRALDVPEGAVMGQGLPNRAVAVSGCGPVRLRNVRRHAPSPRAAGPRAGSRRLLRRPPSCRALRRSRLRRLQPVRGAGPHVVDGPKVRRQGLAGGVPAAPVRKPQALEGGFRGGGSFRRGCHATEGDTRVRDAPRLHGEPEGAQKGGDVLIEALGDLVAAEDLVGLEARHVDTGHELARR